MIGSNPHIYKNPREDLRARGTFDEKGELRLLFQPQSVFRGEVIHALNSDGSGIRIKSVMVGTSEMLNAPWPLGGILGRRCLFPPCNVGASIYILLDGSPGDSVELMLEGSYI